MNRLPKGRSEAGNVSWRSNEVADTWSDSSSDVMRTGGLSTSRTDATTDENYVPQTMRAWTKRAMQHMKRRFTTSRSLQLFACASPDIAEKTMSSSVVCPAGASSFSFIPSEQNTARSSVAGVPSQWMQSHSQLSQTTDIETQSSWSVLDSKLAHAVREELETLKSNISTLENKLQDAETLLSRTKNERDFYKLKCDRLRAKLENNFKALHSAAEAALHLQLQQGNGACLTRVSPQQHQVPMNLQIRVPARHLDAALQRIPAAMNSAKSNRLSTCHSMTATQDSLAECTASPITARREHECDNYCLYVYRTYGISPPPGYLLPSDCTLLLTDRTTLPTSVASLETRALESLAESAASGSPDSNASSCLSPMTPDQDIDDQLGVVETTQLLPVNNPMRGQVAAFPAEAYPYDVETTEDAVLGGTTHSVLVFPSASWTFTPLCN